MQTRKQTRTQPRRRTRPKASTSDVVGGVGPQHVRIPTKWRHHYQHLLELLDHLRRRQEDLAKDAIEEQPVFSSHMADAGTDHYDRDFALGVLSSEQDAVYQIEQAMNRIRSGTYGICELTGKPIEPARLEAIPWTRFSAAAERQIEREGGLKRTRLGPRETVTRTTAAKEPEETT